jgi:hypothetical protein
LLVPLPSERHREDNAMTVGRIATIPLLALISLSGCVENEPSQCSVKPASVNSVVVKDDQNPRNDIIRLDVRVTGGSDSGVGGIGFAVTPWEGETVFRFPYRLVPILTLEAGATVTVTARNAALDLVSTGTAPLGFTDHEECAIRLSADSFSSVELD